MHIVSLSQQTWQQAKALSNSWWGKGIRILLTVAILVGATAVTPTVYADEGVHVVSRGESLGVIARRYSVSTRDLMASNGIGNPDFIYVGQRLRIPGLAAATAETASAANKPLPNGDGYHIVRRGETLSEIAKSNDMALNDLMRLNGLTNANVIWVGQKLRLTARVAAVKVDEEVKPQLAMVHVFKAGDTLEALAQEHKTTVDILLRANGLPHEKFVWVGQRLRIPLGAPAAGSTKELATAPADGRRWIEVNLSDQTLIAWQGDVAVMHTTISSGLPATPTVTGRFRIGTKYSSQRMTGPGYDLPGVPWVMYFYGGYAIHGAYWHNNFGSPMSHGCVNVEPGEAQLLYDWAPPGTEVYVHY